MTSFFYAARGQADDDQDYWSELAGTDASHSIDNKDMTRQEYKAEVDINSVLKRFGAIPQPTPVFTTFDFDIDLQRAIASKENAESAYNRLPEEIRQKYDGWQSMLHAIVTGQLTIDLNELEEDKKATSPATAAT